MLNGETASIGKQGTVKHLPVLFVSLAILLGGIVILFYYIDVVSEKNILKNSELKNIELQTEIIAGDFEAIASDLLILAKMPAFKKLSGGSSENHNKEEALEDIVTHFIAFSEEKQMYDQIRFLDETGMEVLRVNYKNGNPAIVKPDELQSKAKRYYFQRAIKLEADELFVSPFDLNIEKGEIETPIKPVIRFATPVTDTHNRNQGVMVLNYLGKKLLTNLKMAAMNNIGELMLLNSEGYWLLSGNSANNWGFMYESKKDVTFKNRFPKAWKNFSETEKGQFQNKNGLFTFATVYPLLNGQSISGGSTGDVNGSAVAYSWKVVSRVPPSVLRIGTRNIAGKLLILYIAMVGLLAIAVRLLDRPLIHSETLPADKMSPFFLFVVTAVSIFAAESFIMLLLSFVQITSPWLEALVNGLLLVLLVSPFLYIFLFRPLILHIYERRLAEEAFRESEERFRRLSEASFEGVIIHDMGTIIEANQAYADTFGYEISELKGKSTHDLVTEEYVAVIKEKHHTGYDKPYEVIGLRKDGSTFPAEFVTKDAFYEGREVHIGAVRDITKRKEEEDELRNAKEMAENATKLKDKFVSLVSHDLKNPINGMIGFLQLLSNEIDSVISEKGRNMIALTKKNLYKMNDLINELLNISRLKTGRIKPRLKFIDAFRLIRKTMHQLESMADEKGITIINNVPGNSRLYADPALLNEVIQNLLTNAIKFCHAGCTVTFFIPDGEKCTIAVADTGVGIEAERLEKIFHYEEQTSTVGTGGETGTGLGLPLSMDIIKAHNGKMAVESIVNEGTTFFVHLPYMKPKILLMETNQTACDNIKDILGALDMDIIAVENWRQGMALITLQRPHLILLNMEIPQMNGFHFIVDLKKSDDSREIPVIALTSNGGHKIGEKALELGADDFVTNPTTSEELIPRIRKYIH